MADIAKAKANRPASGPHRAILAGRGDRTGLAPLMGADHRRLPRTAEVLLRTVRARPHGRAGEGISHRTTTASSPSCSSPTSDPRRKPAMPRPVPHRPLQATDRELSPSLRTCDLRTARASGSALIGNGHRAGACPNLGEARLAGVTGRSMVARMFRTLAGRARTGPDSRHLKLLESAEDATDEAGFCRTEQDCASIKAKSHTRLNSGPT